MSPGLHRPNAGEHGVVWWDPHTLDLDRDHDVGLRQQRILAADEKGTVAEEGARLHAEWQERRTRTAAAGAIPSLETQTVSEAKMDPRVVAGLQGAARAVTLESTDASRAGRPHGKRFGVLVHAILAMVELGADVERVERTARAQGRLVGATAEEVDAAARSVGAALEHPIFVRARAASQGCRRESQVSLKLEDGSILEGVIDLAFREIEQGVAVWTVVDFKSDVAIGARMAEHRAQVALYARAVAAATGESARGVVLSV